MQRIETQLDRLKLLLDNFVELANLQQQESSLQFQPTDLDAVLNTIVELSREDVAAKHQLLEYRRDMDAAWSMGNAAALSKAIACVVTNAIHYTPEAGKITLRLYRDGDQAVVEVADTGIGISSADLPHVFDSFFRVGQARSTESGGAGLGLSIAKRIIELMQGHIEARSELGKGSVFKIYLPLQP